MILPSNAEIADICDKLDRFNTVSHPQECADLMDEARLMILRLAGHRLNQRNASDHGLPRGQAMRSRLPYPPPWQDISTLCDNICLSEDTVDVWIKKGLLPPPRHRGGKRMWKWTEVETYLENGAGGVPVSPVSDVEQMRENTRRALASKN